MADDFDGLMSIGHEDDFAGLAGRRLQSADVKKASSGLAALRLKLSQSFCASEQATDTEKGLLPCKNVEISTKIKATTDTTEKKKLTEARKALYTAAAAKTDAEKKSAAMTYKALYTKAFGTYCSTNAASDVCTNESMKKMYGGSATAKKAKKKKKQ